MALVRLLSIAALLAWFTLVVLSPRWVGRFYNPAGDGTGRWFHGGVFGLEGGEGFRMQAPLWQPPRAHSDAIHAVVRWPWQPPTQHEHVELVVTSMILRAVLGVIVVGCVLRIAAFALAHGRPDAFVSIMWWLTLLFGTALAAIAGLAVLSGGYAVTDAVVYWTFGAALAIGLLIGVMRWRLSVRRAVDAAAAGQWPTPEQ